MGYMDRTADVNGRYGYRAGDSCWYIIGQGADGTAYADRVAVVDAMRAMPPVANHDRHDNTRTRIGTL